MQIAEDQITYLKDLDVETLKKGDKVNIVLGAPDWEIVQLIFQATPEDSFLVAPANINWPRLLVALGCFSSAPQAAKEWRLANRPKNIDQGFTTLDVGTDRKLRISVYRPFR